MAILLVKIEDASSLALNEFFDYNGQCYGVTCSRYNRKREAISMDDFYEASIDTAMLADVPVVFVMGNTTQVSVIGWYKRAKVYREMQSVSLFLEGNVQASVSDAVLLPDSVAGTVGHNVEKTDASAAETGKRRMAGETVTWQAFDQLYDVVEVEDPRYDALRRMIDDYQGENALQRYPFIHIQMEPKLTKDWNACMDFCSQVAGRVVEDQFQSIVELKSLELYAKKACDLRPKDPDGYYYHALACYQLGFVKNGIKSVEKAIRLEPEASDLKALKGMLLVSLGYHKEGAGLLHLAYENSREEEYLLQEGRVWLAVGQMERAYETLSLIEDETLLEQAGIRLGDMEKKWSFAKIRGMKWKDFWKKKK